MKPLEHAKLNVKTYGGDIYDYIRIHEFMDESKAGLGDKRHRAITHNTWFIYNVLPKVFGSVLTNADEKEISVSEIGEQHILDDFGHKFLPTISDWLSGLPLEGWMNNGRDGYPPSHQGLQKQIIPHTNKLSMLELGGVNPDTIIVD